MRGGYRRKIRGVTSESHIWTPRARGIGLQGYKGSGRFDIWLQRLSHLSQFGVLLLGIWGLAQVVPLFEYEKLERTMEQLKTEKHQLSSQLVALRNEKEGISQDILSLKRKMRVEQENGSILRPQVSLLKNEEHLAKKLLTNTQTDLNANRSALDHARWELILHDLGSQLLHFAFARSTQFSSELDVPGVAISIAEHWWPNPADEMLRSVDAIAKKREVPSTFYSELRDLITARRDKLKCAKPDFQSLRKEHSTRSSQIDLEVKADVETYLNDLKAKYSGENSRFEITDDFKRDAAKRFTNQRRVSLEAEITSRLLDLKFECEGKSNEVLHELANLKSVKL